MTSQWQCSVFMTNREHLTQLTTSSCVNILSSVGLQHNPVSGFLSYSPGCTYPVFAVSSPTSSVGVSQGSVLGRLLFFVFRMLTSDSLTGFISPELQTHVPICLFHSFTCKFHRHCNLSMPQTDLPINATCIQSLLHPFMATPSFQRLRPQTLELLTPCFSNTPHPTHSEIYNPESITSHHLHCYRSGPNH